MAETARMLTCSNCGALEGDHKGGRCPWPSTSTFTPAPSGSAAPTIGARFSFGALEDWQRANKDANARGLMGRVDRLTHQPFSAEGEWISRPGGPAADEPLYESVEEAWEEARRKNMMSPLVEYARQLEDALAAIRAEGQEDKALLDHLDTQRREDVTDQDNAPDNDQRIIGHVWSIYGQYDTVREALRAELAGASEELPRCNEDTHYWPSHAEGETPALGAPCKCGQKRWRAGVETHNEAECDYYAEVARVSELLVEFDGETRHESISAHVADLIERFRATNAK